MCYYNSSSAAMCSRSTEGVPKGALFGSKIIWKKWVLDPLGTERSMLL